jgi:hypothetical protein
LFNRVCLQGMSFIQTQDIELEGAGPMVSIL